MNGILEECRNLWPPQRRTCKFGGNVIICELHIAHILEIILEAERRGLFICTTKYCTSDPKPRVEWSCDINDTVSSFVDRFERKRGQYAVRICDPNNASRVSTYMSRPVDKSSLSSSSRAACTKPDKLGKPQAGTENCLNTSVTASSSNTQTSVEVVTNLTTAAVVTDTGRPENELAGFLFCKTEHNDSGTHTETEDAADTRPPENELPDFVVWETEDDSDGDTELGVTPTNSLEENSGGERFRTQDVNREKTYCWAFTAELVEVLKYRWERRNSRDIAARRLLRLLYK